MTDHDAAPPADLETTLDFVNTTGLAHGQPFDEFATTRQAIDWLHLRTGLHPTAVADSPVVLDRVRRVRTAFRELWDSTVDGRPPAPAAIRAVNQVLRHRSVLELSPDRGQPSQPGQPVLQLASRFTGDEVDCALAELAEPLVRAIGGADAARARICANDTCRWAFFDDSRTHRRRWCEMSSCGNRAKAARHRARMRAADQSGVTSPERPG
ncbi:MAG: CGNR zinc finger domain-containing protein [Candidatus Limnocylindrales bacterium]